ncbi:hypothetical protein EO95_16845 [Methanosarcina sp. 1.H.T.1A.1]|uniref:type I-G CRISPR-associated protein Cas8g1/Csx17 n=1 Tax=Methanosarcina sp. 1.H.T.1A.1 TaxID=1483602 RepID=UPI00062197A5|nr:type I-U CRISPR-associated protein Csx17 [Methanosarcina sp. 1.H.T.1A.1]KKH91822.1 hypothetical protein EO95_16845 [Methanosarcina sp. 1.H.T.1A.1]
MNNSIELKGCSTDTFTDYLKALGVFKIFSQQKDGSARAYWKNNRFVINTAYDSDAMVDFFLHEYAPSPLFRPWGGRSGFYKGSSEKSARDALLPLVNSKDSRFDPFKKVYYAFQEFSDLKGITEKPSDDELITFLENLRSQLPEDILEWLDTCYVLTGDNRIYLPLLGTGGNEGSGNYSSNYLQALNEVLIKKKEKEANQLLEHCLFSKYTPKLSNLSIGQLSPGAVAEANSTEGYRSKSKLVNPWDVVFSMEGATLFAGSASRRFGGSRGTSDRNFGSFPFTVLPSVAGISHITFKDNFKDPNKKSDYKTFENEFWLPLWNRPTSYNEITYLFHEGRAQVGRRPANNGLDFVRAISSLGVDRGIDSFVRYARLKRQGSGKNANALAIPLGTFKVKQQKNVNLIEELDNWLNILRNKCSSKESVAARYSSNLRSIDEAIFSFSKYGDVLHFQNLLIELGKAERSFASAGANRPIRPLNDLSPSWITACDDGSVEFRIACAVASVYDKKVGSIRRQLEPSEIIKGGRLEWSNTRTSVVWSNSDLCSNMKAILQRRVLEGKMKGSNFTPIGGRVAVSLSDISKFIRGEVNDQKISDLMWGLSTIKWKYYDKEKHRERWNSGIDAMIPRAYAFLKLLFIPGNLIFENERWGLSYDEKKGIHLPSSPEILRVIDSQQDKAFELVTRRLKASGLTPLGVRRNIGTAPDFNVDTEDKERIIASLLIPVWQYNLLFKLVLHSPIAKQEI